MLRSGSFRPEQLGQNALALIGNVFFTVFVIGVLVFTIIAATYEPEDPLFHPSTKMTSFLASSTSNATLMSDNTVVKTGEDFLAANQTVFSNFINVTDVATDIVESSLGCDGNVDGVIECAATEVFHLLMRFAIDYFKDIHFYRFGKPVRGENDSTCDMAWRFRPKEGKTASLYKDYRRFGILRSENCTFSVADVGAWHSGVNARKRKKRQSGFEKTAPNLEPESSLPVIGEVVNDSLPVVESQSVFTHGKYLMYMGGGDRCKNMNQYLWSFMCALGEAQYLNRTLVMDLSICLNSMYTTSGKDEAGKDFRYYFDFEHLKESTSVLDQGQFWSDWGKWRQKMTLRVVEDFKVTPMKLKDVKDAFIMRKFGSVEPDNYWYRVCEGETESIVQRPWHLVWKSRRLMDIVSAIASRLNWDYDSVHIVREEKAKDKENTSSEALLLTLPEKIEEGKNVYIATNERDTSFFDPLKEKYSTHFLDEFKSLWDENSEWYAETSKLIKGVPVEFDGYMRASVDTEVFLRGKKQVET